MKIDELKNKIECSNAITPLRFALEDGRPNTFYKRRFDELTGLDLIILDREHDIENVLYRFEIDRVVYECTGSHLSWDEYSVNDMSFYEVKLVTKLVQVYEKV